MSIFFHLVFKKGSHLESAKNKRCSLTITGTSDKKDLHHLQNPSRWQICLWIFSNCSLSSKCNNPYINWPGINRQNFNTHGLPCTSCFFMLETKCLCTPLHHWAVRESCSTDQYHVLVVISKGGSLCSLKREAQIKMNVMTSLQKVCSTSFKRLLKSKNIQILNAAFALACFSLSEHDSSVSLECFSADNITIPKSCNGLQINSI